MSKKMQVRLKKITSATEVSVDLLAINASYNPLEVQADLTAVVQDPEFIASIPEEGACYEICDQGETLNVEPCGEVVCDSTMFEVILREAFELYNTLQYIHWNCRGEKFNDIHNLAENLQWDIRGEIDRIAEWMAADCGRVPHPDTLMCKEGQPYTCYLGTTSECTLEAIRKAVQCFIASLEVFYCNLNHERKSAVDGWLLNWKHWTEYKLHRQLSTEVKEACLPCC